MCTFFADLEVRVAAAEENIQSEKCYACVYAKSVPISHLKEMKEKTMFIVISVYFLYTGLQVTDVNHDARISALEESGGGGSENVKQLPILFLGWTGNLIVSLKQFNPWDIEQITIIIFWW